MKICTIKEQLQEALKKGNLYTECYLVFMNQTSTPQTFISYLKMFNKECLLQNNEDFEYYTTLENDKILMFSKEKNNYYIFVFYE